MASLKLTIDQWERYLARDDVDFEIEELILEGPGGVEHNDTDFNYPPLSVLRIHEGVVTVLGVEGEINLQKHVQEWLESAEASAREADARPFVMVRGPTHLLKAIEAMAKSFQLVDKTIEVTIKLT